MSSSIDQRIVEMAFKGQTFISEVDNTIKALTGLKNSLNSLHGSEKDLNDIEQAGSKFSLKGMGDSLEGIAGKFSHLGVIGITVLGTLVNKAVSAGLQMLKALTIDPIKAGLDVYETKINAIQTILANTSAAGTTLHQVTDALNQLNIYANKTVYNFGQMAQNIGTFTAAGVGLQTSVASIKGIANLAALSGSSAEQASTAMYQLSQAIATGSLKLQDWNSVVNAGLGGKVFQNALIETARVQGVQIDKMIAKDHGFRNTLQEGWLTSKILTDTLKTFTGDLSAEQLKSMGYTDAETKAILKQAQAAVDSATKIRTITQLQAALREEVATAWAGVWEALLGNINQASDTLSSLHNVLESLFTGPVNKLAALLRQFNKLGGRAEIILAIKQAFEDLGRVLKPIGEAFKEVFPPAGVQSLIRLSVAIDNFVNKLRLSDKGMADLKATFKGIFSIIKIVIDVIGGVGHALAIMFGAAASGGGGFLDLTAKIGNFISKVREMIESGGALTKFFTGLGKVLSIPIKAIDAIINALGGFGGVIGRVEQALSPFVQKIGNAFSKVGEAIGNGFKSGNFTSIISTLNHALFGGILLAIRKFISNLGGGEKKAGLFDTIKESFEGLTGALQAMQTNLKSGTLQKIAIAVGILAASMVALSFIDVKNLAHALAAMTIMFTQLLGAMAVVAKISGAGGIVRMPIIAAALNLLATSMVILAGAVAILAQFSWEQLAKGLTAITILLGELVTATAFMSADSKGILTAAFSMKALAVAIDIMAIAVGHLGKLDLGTLAKGIGSIAILLGILKVFNTFGGEGTIRTAASLVILGEALLIIAQAVKTLGSLSIGQLAKGLIAIAGTLIIIAGAMAIMPDGMVATAASLLVISAALLIMSKALVALGGQSWNSVAKSLVVLAGSLIIIAAAMLVMIPALPGAAALLVVAAALAVLTPVLVALGGLSWEAIAKGLVALAGVFLVIGAAGLLLGPVVPILLLLGAAIALLGAGILAAGIGIGLFAAGLTALAVAIAASGSAILSFVKNILGLFPAAMKAIGDGVVAFAGSISRGTVAITNAFVAIFTAIINATIKIIPLMAKAFDKILTTFLDIVNKDSPKVIKTFFTLVLNLLNAISKNYPKFLDAGIALIVNIINGIARKVTAMANAATNLIIAFLNAITRSTLRVTQAGINMVISLINGIANQIRRSTPAMNAAVGNLATAIITGLVEGILSGLSSVVSAIINIAKSALDKAKQYLGINSPSKEFMKIGAAIPEGTALGINNNVRMVTDSVEKMGDKSLDALGTTLGKIGDVISSNMDLYPRITPVIDLTKARQGLGELSTLSKSQLIAASASSNSAAAISSASATVDAIKAEISNSGGAATSFVQNNYSPKALDAITIYRQTKTQLSRSRGALGIAIPR